MEEVFFTGYCRCIDQSRMVTVETCNGETNVDCEFFSCPYGQNCQIGINIQKLIEE